MYQGTYDVAVLGGGFAGVGAALSAAREGCRVILIDKGNALGGAAVNCLVNPFMSYSTKINGVQTELNAGIFKEIVDQLRERNALMHTAFLEEELAGYAAYKKKVKYRLIPLIW